MRRDTRAWTPGNRNHGSSLESVLYSSFRCHCTYSHVHEVKAYSMHYVPIFLIGNTDVQKKKKNWEILPGETVSPMYNKYIWISVHLHLPFLPPCYSFRHTETLYNFIKFQIIQIKYHYKKFGFVIAQWNTASYHDNGIYFSHFNVFLWMYNLLLLH